MNLPQNSLFREFLDAIEEARSAGNGPSNVWSTFNRLFHRMTVSEASQARAYLASFFEQVTPWEAAQVAVWLFHGHSSAQQWALLAAVLWSGGRGRSVLHQVTFTQDHQTLSHQILHHVALLREFATKPSRWQDEARELSCILSGLNDQQVAPISSPTPPEQAQEVLERMDTYARQTSNSAWIPGFQNQIQALSEAAKIRLLEAVLDSTSISPDTTEAERGMTTNHHRGIIHTLLPAYGTELHWSLFNEALALHGGQLLQFESIWNRESRRHMPLPTTVAFQEQVRSRARTGTFSAASLAVLRLSSYQDDMMPLALQPELNPGEAWSDAVLARLDALSPERREPWPALVAFARTATAGKPTAKWLRDAEAHVKAVGAAPFREVLTDALPLLSRPRTFRLNPGQYGGDPNLLLDEFNALSLKGLLWMVPLAADDALTRAVAGVVEAALRKVPGVGPRAPKIANAAVYALSRTESGAALSALARLNTTVTFKGTLKEVSKALDVVAARLNVTPDELLELGTPTLGLGVVGERVEVLGDVQVRLSVDARGAHLEFSRAGKPLKSVPAAVKKDFAEDLKELKAAQKEAEQVTAALAQRLDALMIEPRTWVGAAWLERYLNHPLAGTVARRLIWLVDGVPALWGGGELRDVQGAVVPVSPTSGVALWHPIGRDVAEVLAWRARLEVLDVRQPFKQAWREVYVLTDAERRTGTYSNRFAGHILRQHQFHALAAARGWRNRLRLMVDDSYPPAMRDLPAYGLRAEYWIEGVGENYGEDSTESGAYLRLTTDQVRFYPLAAPENHAHAGGGGYTMWVNQAQQPLNPLPLEDIPPLVLSEVLRDVDLFVGVASVGNDPTWQDGGPGGRFREYWQSYSFGELNETARTRAAYLERLIPRLKIRDRLSLDGRFLRVQGDRRAYRIHLGSSNILMEPNDQYLCIIPGGKGSGPDVDFDGDRVLSLVLSKAFLLADDTAITDPVILEQLGR